MKERVGEEDNEIGRVCLLPLSLLNRLTSDLDFCLCVGRRRGSKFIVIGQGSGPLQKCKSMMPSAE